MQVDPNYIKEKLLDEPSDFELVQLAAEAHRMLQNTGSYSTELFNAQNPADLHAYALLAVLQAEGRQAGMRGQKIGDEMVKTCKANIANMSERDLKALVRQHVENIIENDLRDLIDITPDKITPETRHLILARVFPVVESWGYLVAAGERTFIPGYLQLLVALTI